VCTITCSRWASILICECFNIPLVDILFMSVYTYSQGQILWDRANDSSPRLAILLFMFVKDNIE